MYMKLMYCFIRLDLLLYFLPVALIIELNLHFYLESFNKDLYSHLIFPSCYQMFVYVEGAEYFTRGIDLLKLVRVPHQLLKQ